MTCIVGIEHDNGVTIGADAASSDGWSIDQRTNGKLFRNGDYLFGFTSSWRMGQILQYSLNVDPPDTWDVDRFMATTFINAVRCALKDGGFAHVAGNTETGGTFLVAVAGRLYAVHDDYQVARSAMRYAAVGSGAQVALGSLHTSLCTPATYGQVAPARACLLALDAASQHTASVTGPHQVEHLPH